MEDSKEYRFSYCRVISTVGVIFLLLATMYLNDQALRFMDVVYSPFLIILVLGYCFFLSLGTFGRDFIRFIPDSFRVLMFEPLRPNLRYAEIARFASRYIIGGAVIVTIISLIQMTSNMGDPGGIGLAIAAAMLPSLYALIISETFLAVVYKSYADKEASNMKKPLGMRNALLPLFVICLSILLFFLLSLSFTYDFSV